jgi:metallo-beta-lactamase class B
MNARLLSFVTASVVAVVLSTVPVFSQGAVESHKAAAKAASEGEGGWGWMYNRLCEQALDNIKKGPAPTPFGGQQAGPPARETWHAEPMKVFDNAWWLGQTEFSAWAITGSRPSDGIILMDAIYDYSVKDEVVDGAKKMGLDPAKIKYAVMGHWHEDHAGGAKTLKELFGTEIYMGPADWENLAKQAPTYKMAKDKSVSDGTKLTAGDEIVTLYNTPGHTAGTVSSIIPVKDNGEPHTIAYWGGTMYNWINRTRTGTSEYVRKPEKLWFKEYADSADRFKKVAAGANADIIFSNHTAFDGSKEKMPKLKERKAGQPHPYVVGKKGVQNYLTVVGECARAGELLTKN